MWRETTKHQRNLKIWKEELEGFLPDKILDFHVHIFNDGVVPTGAPYICGGQPIERYDFEDFQQDLAECYPGKQTLAVCFGSPHTEYDFARNNDYIASECDGTRFIPFRLFDPNEHDHQAVKQDIINGGFVGLKPYLNYVRKDDLDQVEVHEMLPAWIMEIANELGLIIMLHIPRKERLADPLNQKQVVELCERYPNCKIVLAHIGRAYYMENIVGNLDKLKDIPNLYYDLAMLNNWEVLEYLFKTVGWEKVLYGTDIPIALAPGKSVEINDQYTYVTPVPWKLSISDDHRKIRFTSFLYEELRAIKKAVERLQLPREFVEGLFYKNGISLLSK
jgi:Amidohydrolase